MSDLLVSNKVFYDFELNFLIVFGWITKITFVLFFIGFINKTPDIFVEFYSIVKIFLGIFLIYRFNSFRNDKVVFTELDRKVCYSAGIFIILISFIDIMNKYIDIIRSKILPYTTPITNYLKQITGITPANEMVYSYN